MAFKYLLMAIYFAGLAHSSILFIELKQNFMNVNYASSYDLTFRLTNRLITSGYLLVIFPVQLIIPSASFYSNDCAGASAKQGADISDASFGSTYIYYVNFPVELTAFNTYTLQLVSTTAVLVSGVPVRPIELYSVSSKSSDSIIIDSNPSFGWLYFEAAPTNTLGFSDISSAHPLDTDKIGNKRTYDLEITPTISVSNTGRILAKVSNSLFGIDSSTCSNAVNPDHTCSISENGAVFEILAPLIPATTIRITIVVNQALKASSSDLEIYVLLPYANLITEYTIQANFFSAVQHDWTGQYTTKVGWGVNLNDASLPDSFRLYTNGPNLIVYNSIRFAFTPSISTPQVKQKLSVDLTGSMSTLESSIFHNLPAFDANGVSCTSAASIDVKCRNIGSLSAGMEYFIALRFSFPNGLAGLPNVDSNFGKIALFAWSESLNDYFSSSINIVGRSSYPSTVTSNLDRLIIVSSSQRAPVHTYIVGSSVTTEGDGVKKRTINQALEFAIDTKITDFGASGADKPGLEIFTTGNVLKTSGGTVSDTNNCFADYAGFTTSDVAHCQLSTQTIAGTNALRMVFSMSAPATGNSVFNSYHAFGFKDNIQVSTHASYIADDQTLDFYVSAVQDSATLPATFYASTDINANYMLNSYTIDDSAGVFSGLSVLITNFWTSNSADLEGLTGSAFPSTFRIKGSLSPTEADVSVSKLTLFYANLEPFPIKEDLSSAPQRISCGSTRANVNCKKYSGSSNSNAYLLFNRIDITIDIDDDYFDIVIPVGTIPNIDTVSYAFATVSNHHSSNANQDFGTINQIEIFSVDFGALGGSSDSFFSSISAAVQGLNYRLEINNNIVGQETDAVIKANHHGGINLPNAGSAQAASFMYVARWNFLTTASTIASATVTGSEACIKFEYYFPLDSSYPDRYGLFCPINQDIDMLANPSSEPRIEISKFRFPSVEGQNIPLTYSVVSDNIGIMKAYQSDYRQQVLDPNHIAVDSLEPTLYRTERSSTLRVTFTLLTPLYGNSVLRMEATEDSWYFSLKQGQFCYLTTEIKDVNNYHFPNNCEQSLSGRRINFQLLDPEVVYPAGTFYLYIYEIDIGPDVLSSSLPFKFQELTSKMKIISETPSAVSLPFLTQSRQLALSLLKVSPSIDTGYSETYLQLTFEAKTKPIPRGTDLKWDFFTNGNQIDTSYARCVVKTANEGLFPSAFRTCKVDSTSLTLGLALDLPTLKSYTITLEGIRIGSRINQPRFYLLDRFQETVRDSSIVSVYPSFLSAPLNFSKAILSKRANSALIVPDIRIVAQLTVQVDKQSVLYVRFPTGYYSTPHANNPPLCHIEGYELYCYYDGLFGIRLTDFPIAVPANKAFQLSILGPRQAQFSQSETQNLVIYFMNRNNFSKALYIHNIRDIAPQSVTTQNLIEIEALEYQSTEIIQQTSVTVSFTLKGGSIADAVDNTLLIDFPIQYTSLMHNSSVSLDLVQGSAAILNNKKARLRGFRLELSLEDVTLALDTTIKLSINNIPTSEGLECPAPVPMLSLLKSDGITIAWISYGPRSLHKKFSFEKSSTKEYFAVEQIRNYSSIPMTTFQPLKATIGIWSPRIRIKPALNTRFRSNVEFTFTKTANPKLYSDPPHIEALIGEEYAEFRIRFPESAAAGLYALKLSAKELSPIDNSETNFYSALPNLLLQVVSDPHPVILPYFEDDTVIIGKEGRSFPIEFDFIDMLPTQNLKVTAYIPPLPDLKIEVFSRYNFEVNFTNTVALFTLINTAVPAITDTSTVLSFFVTGFDASRYEIESKTLTVRLESTTTIAPIITYQYDSNNINTSSLQIRVSSTQTSYIYYTAVGRYGIPSEKWEYQNNSSSLLISDQDARIRSLYREGYRNNVKEKVDEFSGKIIYSEVGPLKEFKIEGMRSNVAYTVNIWAENLAGTKSDVETFDVTLTDNNERFFRLRFAFSDELTETLQLNKVSCAVNQYLAIPYKL